MPDGIRSKREVRGLLAFPPPADELRREVERLRVRKLGAMRIIRRGTDQHRPLIWRASRCRYAPIWRLSVRHSAFAVTPGCHRSAKSSSKAAVASRRSQSSILRLWSASARSLSAPALRPAVQLLLRVSIVLGK